MAQRCPFKPSFAPVRGGLLLAAGWLLSLLPAMATVLHGPMLQGGTATNVYVLVECSIGTSSPMAIDYGTTTAYGSSASTAFANTTSLPSYVHVLKLTNLAPNTTYHYQVRGQGTTSPDYTFQTAATPGTPFRFAWACDFRNGTAVHGQIARAILYSNSVPAPPLFCLSAGDYADNNLYSSWTNQWLVPDEQTLEEFMVSYLAPGNHDGWSGAVQMQSFDQPPDSSGTNGYYSFDCGDLHVTVANYMYDYSVGSAQYNWIQQDVQASLKPWKIFAAHAPAYTYTDAHPGDPGFQTITTNLLEPHGVKLFLAGHNHFYQRNLINGLHHITCGGAGAPLYSVSSSAYTIVAVSDNCYLIADVSPTNLHVAAYNNLDAVLDDFTLMKPPAPLNVTATPGNGQVGLTWDAVAGASGYTVLYGAVSGGPYPSQQTVTAPNALLLGLLPDTPYYFVVIANSADGPSAASAQVSATPFPPTTPTITSFGLLEDGNFRLSGAVLSGRICVLETTSNLVPPISWVAVATNTSSNDSFFLSDLQATNYARRFYRVRSP